MNLRLKIVSVIDLTGCFPNADAIHGPFDACQASTANRSQRPPACAFSRARERVALPGLPSPPLPGLPGREGERSYKRKGRPKIQEKPKAFNKVKIEINLNYSLRPQSRLYLRHISLQFNNVALVQNLFHFIVQAAIHILDLEKCFVLFAEHLVLLVTN